LQEKFIVAGATVFAQEAWSLDRICALAILVIMIELAGGISDVRIVPSSEVSAKIRTEGVADFSNCIIEGILNLSELNIAGPIHFNNTIFKNQVNFNSTTFNGETYLLNATFNEGVSFKDSVFNGFADFQRTKFNNEAIFTGAVFNSPVSFSDARFNGAAYFCRAVYNGKVHFMNTVFNVTSEFGSARFMNSAYFEGAIFKEDANIWIAVFNGYAVFADTKFNNAYFVGTQFNKEAHFERAQFAGKASFSDVSFKEDALFDNADFNGKLSLTRARYNKLYIRWYNISGGLVYDDTAYMALMKNFKDLGYFEDYDSCYFQYRSAHRGQPWPAVSGWEQFMRKKIDYPLEWFYGYGTKPFNAFFFSLAIVLVFALFWWRVGLGGREDGTLTSLPAGEEWLDGDIADILAFSATVFLSGTRLFIDPPPLPRIEGRSRSMIKKAFILERVLGALFSVLFFIAISGTITRAS
jgi:hypothetical protein